MSLNNRLDKIQMQSLYKQKGVIYIYRLIEDNLEYYKEIFGISEGTDDEIRDEIYSEIYGIFSELRDHYTRQFGITMFIRKISDKSDKPEVKLGRAELRLMGSEESEKEHIRSRILREKKERVKKNFFTALLKKEKEITVSEEEINNALNSWCFNHVLVLTEKGKSIINGYNETLGIRDMDSLREESRKSFLNIIGNQ